VSVRALLRTFAGFALALFLVCLALTEYLSVHRGETAKTNVVSVWQGGARRARTVVAEHPERALAEAASEPGATRVVEEVLDDGPVLSLSPFLFGMSFVAARDGVQASIDGRTAYATPDDLIQLGAYNSSISFGNFKLKFGVDAGSVFPFLARELGVSEAALLSGARFRRVAMRRRLPAATLPKIEINAETLRASAVGAGRYLARAVGSDGKFRYEVDGATGEESGDYNLPRHAGATWYLAEVAAFSGDRTMKAAARRAARYLVEHHLLDCGARRCIATAERADLGSSALALLGFTKLVDSGVGPEFREEVALLAEFLRSQQRPDGEFQHLYDRAEKHPVDVQLLYYTGEAAFALSRAYHVTNDIHDLAAAKQALRHLVKPPPWYIGWRYYWGAEHWTCHAMADLWDRAPDHKALKFCLDWMEFVRNTAVYGREPSPEYDGASTSGPFVPPQLVVSSCRLEAGVSTLSAARRAGVAPRELERLEEGLRGMTSFLLRSQFLPGPAHLMPDPDAMFGGFPASETDFHVRIDYPQHAAIGILNYLLLTTH
jgi:hypothetical protein